jgi:hypothetical protein
MQPKDTQSPFGAPGEKSFQPQIPIILFFLLFIVSFAFLVMVACAIAMPEVGSQVRRLFGSPKGSSDPNFLSQLRFLLVCYSSPLVLTGGLALMNYIVTQYRTYAGQRQVVEEASPFD